MAAGVRVTVLFCPEPPKTMLALGTRVMLDELPVTFRLAVGVSTSEMVKARAEVGVSSLMVWSRMLVMVGASLTLETVKIKVSVAVAVPSETVTVMVAVPD